MSSLEIAVLVRIVDADADDEERDFIVREIMREIAEADESLGAAEHVRELAPLHSKGFGSAVVGAFRAIVQSKRLREFFAFLKERLKSRPVELEVAAEGRVLRIRAASAKELSEAADAACRFIEARGPSSKPSQA